MRRTLTIRSEPANLCKIRKVAREFATACKFDPHEIELIVLGLDEACSNVIRHAYQNLPDGHIRLVCDTLSGRLRFRLRDFGQPCDPAMFSSKLELRSLESVRPGGLGLHFIRKAFDEIQYVCKGDGTELVLIKKCGNR